MVRIPSPQLIGDVIETTDSKRMGILSLLNILESYKLDITGGQKWRDLYHGLFDVLCLFSGRLP